MSMVVHGFVLVIAIVIIVRLPLPTHFDCLRGLAIPNPWQILVLKINPRTHNVAGCR